MITRKTVYAWRCGCSKTAKAIEYSKKVLEHQNGKIIYACPTIQMEKEVKRKLKEGLVINSKESLADIDMTGNSWEKIQKKNRLLKSRKCLIVTHARLMNTDPGLYYDPSIHLNGTKSVIIDEFAMKLRKFYIQRATLMAYITHPYHSVPEYVTYEDTFDENHRRRENYWQEWDDDMYKDWSKKIHKIHVSKTLMLSELKTMFPYWFSQFSHKCKEDRIWSATLSVYERLCLTFRRSYPIDDDAVPNSDDYGNWLWLTPAELKDNGLDVSDILGSSYSMLDNHAYRWEKDGKYNTLHALYSVFGYQTHMTYIMLMIARQIASDEYFDTDINDGHPGYYVGGFNPMERWLLQNVFNVICLDGSAMIFKDIYEHYGFNIINDRDKSITHYADNLNCRMFNFKSFTQTSIQKMTLNELKGMLCMYFSPYVSWAKCWYVIVPSKCNTILMKAFRSLYGKDSVCDCTTKGRSYVDDEGEDRQISIKTSLSINKKARFIFVNHEGQIGSNEFYERCDGILALSQLNLPKNMNKMYSEYYDTDNYSDLYSAHTIYQESARAKNRLMKPINYKEGHKIPFVAFLSMNPEQYRTFNRLNTGKKIFDDNEDINAERMSIF